MCVYSVSVYLVLPSFAGYLIDFGCIESTPAARTLVCAPFLSVLSGYFMQVYWIYVECVYTHILDRASMHILYLYCLDYDLVQVYLLQMCMTHLLIMLFVPPHTSHRISLLRASST